MTFPLVIPLQFQQECHEISPICTQQLLTYSQNRREQTQIAADSKLGLCKYSAEKANQACSFPGHRIQNSNRSPVLSQEEFRKFRDEDFEHLLNALEYREKNYGNNGEKEVADFIAPAKVLRYLLTKPFNKARDIDINVLWFDGQIFLNEDMNILEAKSSYPLTVRQAYQHRNQMLREYITTPIPFESDEKLENRVMCSLLRSAIGNLKMIMSSHVDGVESNLVTEESVESPQSYIYIYSHLHLTNPKLKAKYDFAMYRMWAYNFLVGSDKFVTGFHNDSEELCYVQEYKTHEIPGYVERSTNSPQHTKWNDKKSISFFITLLDTLKQVIPKDETRAWRLEYKKSNNCLQLAELKGTESQNVLNSMPETFVKWRRSLKTKE